MYGLLDVFWCSFLRNSRYFQANTLQTRVSFFVTTVGRCISSVVDKFDNIPGSPISLEKEQTEKDILRLSREIETLTRTNFHQYNFSPGVCRNISETKTKLCDSQEKSRVVESELSSLKAAIKDVYGQLNCESFIPGSQLVLGEAVTDSNVMQFLAIIEQVSSALVVVIIKSSVFEVVPKPHISLLSEILPAVCC